jgi:hypothetical protein
MQRILFFALFIAFSNAMHAQVETYNKKYRQTALKPYCDYCELPLDRVTSRFIYLQTRDTNATKTDLFTQAESVVRSICLEPDKQIVLRDPDAGKIIFTRTVELSAGNSVNGFKKMGKCKFKVAIEVKDNMYRYTINEFIMEGSNRPLETYLESLRHNAKSQQQISFQIISVIEGFNTEKGHYVEGIIDRIVTGMNTTSLNSKKK